MVGEARRTSSSRLTNLFQFPLQRSETNTLPDAFSFLVEVLQYIRGDRSPAPLILAVPALMQPRENPHPATSFGGRKLFIQRFYWKGTGTLKCISVLQGNQWKITTNLRQMEKERKMLVILAD